MPCIPTMFKRPGHGTPQRESVNAAKLISTKDDSQIVFNAAIATKISNLEKLPILFQRLALAFHAYKAEQTQVISNLTEQLSKFKVQSLSVSGVSANSDFEHINTVTSPETLVSPVNDSAIDADITAILTEAAQVGHNTDLTTGSSEPSQLQQNLRIIKDNVEGGMVGNMVGSIVGGMMGGMMDNVGDMPELQDATPSILSSRLDGDKPKKKKKQTKKGKKKTKKDDESSSSEED